MADVWWSVDEIIKILTALGLYKGGEFTYQKVKEKKNGTGTELPILTEERHRNICNEQMGLVHREIKETKEEIKLDMGSIKNDFREDVNGVRKDISQFRTDVLNAISQIKK